MMEMKRRFDLNLNQKTGQCRAIPVKYNGAEHILVIYGADFDVDPYEEMFYFPQDTLKMSMITLDGEILWTRSLSRDVIPGVWFCPVYAFDLDGDGDDEIYFPDNKEQNHPLSLKGTVLCRLSPFTGEVTGEFSWTKQKQEKLASTYRRFIMGGYANGVPVLMIGNGTYGEMRIVGFNPDMTVRFETVIPDDGIGARGSHMCAIADINGDGVDELFWGERCIEISSGKEAFCADKDSWNGHSDIAQPFFDGDKWRLFTCRENNQEQTPRIAVYDNQGRRVWGALDSGHIDMGWVARGEDDYICCGIKIGAKTCGSDGRFHQNIQQHIYNAITGEELDIGLPAYKTIPVDTNGDGVHEFIMGAPGGDGSVYSSKGKLIANLGGAVALATHFEGCGDGEQILTYTDSGTITLWYNPDAKDTPDAKARYQSRFYQVNRKLFAVGYNYSNLAGI